MKEINKEEFKKEVEVQSVPGEGTTFTFTFMELTSLEEYE